ncbi:MAG TPA: aminotransferase class I/II-fold pyridoxal phosphate-dependent enzyme [Verrucomicrobiae bacterium]|nr:aminotransferase class I/II-fold pyridoxal phosphate-dependent enzyme [Verrucomicrobiae bacterium]
MTPPEPLQQIDRTWVIWRGQTLAYFAGCDYFRLATHPKVVAAAQDAITKFGLNVAASRFTTGNHALYNQLENSLAEFFAAECALIVSNGYLTNLAVVQGLRDRFSHILLDERAHMSLADAAASAHVEVILFSHRNATDVQRKLPKYAKALLMTDGVFAHDGAVAPLREYQEALHHDAWILVDDSHGAGVLGEQGRGTPEHLGVSRDRVIQTTTLSKAFGCYGGAIIATKEICDAISLKSAILTGATPFPLSHAGASIAAVEVLKCRELRSALRANLQRLGLETPVPIHAHFPADENAKRRLIRELLARGIFPTNIRYQNGPAEGYFRFAISSEHSRAQLNALVDALRSA